MVFATRANPRVGNGSGGPVRARWPIGRRRFGSQPRVGLLMLSASGLWLARRLRHNNDERLPKP